MLLFLRQMTYYLINLSLDLPLSYILTSYSTAVQRKYLRHDLN